MKTRTGAALILVATLVIGVVIGALGGRAFMMKQRPWGRPPGVHGERPGPGPDKFADRFVQRLEEMLEIDDAQRDTVHAILAVHMDQMMVLNEEHRAEASVLMDTLLLEMRGVLTDEQLETFEEHLKRRQLRGPKGRFRHGP